MARLSAPNFADCLTVGEAADYLGVSTATLRNWDRTGKLKPRRHPKNGYRIYLHEDLEAVLRSADLSQLADENVAPKVDWTQMRDSEHFVQFYESDEYLIDSVSGFVAAALNQNDSSVVIANPQHRQALERKLAACAVDITVASAEGHFVFLDAAETLSKFMVGGVPDVERFNDVVGNVVAKLARGGRRVHAVGEMVALLWVEGNRDAAIRLEELWNELAKSHRFALFCAYPIAGFNRDIDGAPFDGICNCHSRVIPAESYSAISNPDGRLRAISLLQQKAQSLEAEIEHRKAVEVVARRKDEFLATLSNELRNPLAPIKNALEVLRVDSGAETIVKARSIIERQVGQLTRLVDELLDLNGITREGMELRDDRVELATVANDAVKTIRPAAELAISKLRILVVDDNKDSGDTLSTLLRVKGHDTCTARDGLQAIDLVEQFRPNVVLMDVGMPKLNGYEATKRIRLMPGGGDIVIIAITGWGQPDDIERSAQAGCSAHMVKPVDFAALERLLANVI